MFQTAVEGREKDARATIHLGWSQFALGEDPRFRKLYLCRHFLAHIRSLGFHHSFSPWRSRNLQIYNHTKHLSLVEIGGISQNCVEQQRSPRCRELGRLLCVLRSSKWPLLKTEFSINPVQSNYKHRNWNSPPICEAWVREFLSKLYFSHPGAHESSLAVTILWERKRMLSKESGHQNKCKNKDQSSQEFIHKLKFCKKARHCCTDWSIFLEHFQRRKPWFDKSACKKKTLSIGQFLKRKLIRIF